VGAGGRLVDQFGADQQIDGDVLIGVHPLDEIAAPRFELIYPTE
jgi:hypothetical protein